MKPLEFSSTDLLLLQDQLDSWRQRQSGRCRLPPALWDAAVSLTRAHGVSHVARALRIGFYALQRRLRQLPAFNAPSNSPNAFIELKLDPSQSLSSPTGLVELIDGPHRRMRIHTGPDPAAWISLAHSFWRNPQ